MFGIRFLPRERALLAQRGSSCRSLMLRPSAYRQIQFFFFPLIRVFPTKRGVNKALLFPDRPLSGEEGKECLSLQGRGRPAPREATVTSQASPPFISMASKLRSPPSYAGRINSSWYTLLPSMATALSLGVLARGPLLFSPDKDDTVQSRAFSPFFFLQCDRHPRFLNQR